jgi:Tol biopolymer transport system component
MNELRDLLEHGAIDFEPPPSGWDRLLRRARKRRALRRMTAGVVASAVASAGLGMVLIAFGGTERPQPPATPVENGKIAFSKGGPNAGIYLMNADGTGVTRLTSDPSDSEPAWAPDGTVIAFVRSGEGDADVYVMNANGNEVTPLTTDGANSAPAWSPDGSKIAFTRETPGNTDIYVMNPDGSNVTRLTNDPLLESAPTWSPDGSRIAFSAYVSPPGPVHIYTMGADGTSRTRITDSELDDASPTWSPDGTSIAFVRDSGSVFVVEPDGRGPREVIDPGVLTGGLGLTFYPTWSPAGTKILFQSGPDGSDQGIYMVSADGSDLHKVGSGKGSDPSWQPVPPGKRPRTAHLTHRPDSVLKLQRRPPHGYLLDEPGRNRSDQDHRQCRRGPPTRLVP